MTHIQDSTTTRSTREISPAVSLRVAIARIYRALRTRTDQNLTPSQTSALARIEQSEPVRLGVLAQLEGVKAATMSKIVESLEAIDLVQRSTDPLDGRVSMVHTSAIGRGLIEDYRAASTLAIEDALTTLSTHERRLLLESLPVLEKLSELLQTRDITD